MKRKLLILTLLAGAVLMVTGCSNGSKYSKYVTLGEYTGMSIDRVVTELTDADVQYEIQNELSELAETNEITDRPAQSGDIVTVDYVGTLDGEEFEGGSDTDVELELGTGDYIDGFEDAVIGMEVDETKDFDLTFPEDYDGELDGKTATFTLTLKSISEVTLPEYNDDYVKEYTDYSSTEEYEAALKDQLQMSYDEEADYMACYDALAAAIENAEVKKFPEDMLEKAKTTTQESYEMFAEQFGMSVEDLMGEDYDMDAEAEDYVKEMLVVYAIAEKEKLTVSDQDCQDFIDNNWEAYGYESPDELKEAYTDEELEYEILYSKVLQFLAENNTFVDVDDSEFYEAYDEQFEDDEETDEEGDDVLEFIEENEDNEEGLGLEGEEIVDDDEETVDDDEDSDSVDAADLSDEEDTDAEANSSAENPSQTSGANTKS